MTIRPAIYIGGNFTELVLENDGANHTVKELTTLDCPTDGLILGVDQILEQARMKAGSIKLIVHGTTLATNAMIKRRRAGGDGQIIKIEHREGAPFAVFALFDRIENPAQGRDGGVAGRPGRAYLSNGKALKGKGKQIVPAGLSLVLELPGGGGLGTDGDNL